MDQEEILSGVMFADVCDSTGLFRSYTTATARRIILQALDLCGRAVQAYGGEVIDRIGDEIMCRFDTVEEMVQSAICLQSEVDEAGRDQRLPCQVMMRVGFHFGPILHEDNSIFGDTVHMARRLASHAKAQQILTTKAVLDRCSDSHHVTSRFVDRIQIKGKAGQYEIHEILWSAESATLVVGAPTKPPDTHEPPAACLRLRCCDQELTLDSLHPGIKVGRALNCELVIDEEAVSRLHARIGWQNGHYTLHDISTNGTTITPDHGPTRRLRRQQAPLEGRGTISPGLNPRPNGSNVIAYEVFAPK